MQEPHAPRATLVYSAGVTALVALAAWILARDLGNVPYEPRSDDGYYLEYAKAVSNGGPGVFPRLFAGWNANQASWIYPSPLRIGFVCVSALWVKCAGATLPALSWLSIVSHLGWIAVTGFFARRHFVAPRAFLITLLASFAPLLLGTARQALQDSFLLLTLALSVWTFLETVERPAARGWKIAFVASFSFAILTKELAVLLVPAFVLFALHERSVRRDAQVLRRTALLLGLCALITAPLFLWAAGGFGPLSETIRIVLGSPATNVYAIKYGSGPWYRYLIDYLCLSPGVTLLALGFAGITLARIARGVGERVQVYLWIVAACLLFEMGFFTKNARYLLVLELPLVVFAVSMLCELVPERVRARWIAIGAAVLLLAWLDWRTFDYGWIEHGIYDPLSGALFQLRDILPPPGK